MTTLGFILCGLLTVAAANDAPPTIFVKDCQISVDQKADVPAQEQGVLTRINVAEGAFVKEGQPLAQIDDSIPQMQLEVARYKLKAAQEEAKSDVNLRYTMATAETARSNYNRSVAANNRTKGSVPDEQLDEQRLKITEAELGNEKAVKDLNVAKAQAEVSDAEVRAADENLRHRKIDSPLDGDVSEIKFKRGEWVKPGDTVICIRQMNRLRVEGEVSMQECSPNEITGRPAVVQVELARGRKVEFPATVVFVNPSVSVGGGYKVRAMVENRQEKGQWLLRDGMPASMTIKLK